MSTTITETVMTSSAAPSQWELKLSDGRRAYIRYRHAELQIGLGDTIEKAIDASAAVDLNKPFRDQRECTWDDVEPYVLDALERKS